MASKAPPTQQKARSQPVVQPSVPAMSVFSQSAGGSNRSLARLLRMASYATPPASSLRISSPSDPAEREAERVAAEVMRMPDDAVVPAKTTTADPSLHRKCSACEHEEEQELHRSPAGESPVSIPSVVNQVLSQPGRQLSQSTRDFFEPRLGVDFSAVRIHDDAQAAESATAVQARAYTVGNSIAFAAGQYAPEDPSGQSLLAHELVHVVQMSSGGGDGLNRLAEPTLMRAALFNSTVSICHRVLKSREFHVTEGGVVVSANAGWDSPEEWKGEGPFPCGAQQYHMTLTQTGTFLDSEYGTCTFDPGRPESGAWGSIPEGDYFLTIYVNTDNPKCCLDGTIEVLQQSGLSEGCTKPPPGAMEIIHTGLDLAGLIPVLGVAPDIFNAGLYLIEGDWVGAGVSAVGMLPFIGGAAIAARRGKAALRIAARDAEKLGAEGISNAVREARIAEKEAAAGSKATTREAEEAAQADAKLAEFDWPTRRRWLRDNSPSPSLRNKYRGKRFDPLYKGVIVEGGLEADHIVPFDRITKMNGFDKLPIQDQLRILNYEPNFEGISGTINASRGNKTFKAWDEAGGHFLHGRPENRAILEKLIQRENELTTELEVMISDAVRAATSLP